jgi:hypothetical protein
VTTRIVPIAPGQPGPLFDHLAAPARGGNAVQRAAADHAAARVGKQCLRILRTLAAGGPMLAEELVYHTGLRRASICGRLGEMERPRQRGPAILHDEADEEPLVVKAGKRLAASGVESWLYDITPAGRRALR